MAKKKINEELEGLEELELEEDLESEPEEDTEAEAVDNAVEAEEETEESEAADAEPIEEAAVSEKSASSFGGSSTEPDFGDMPINGAVDESDPSKQAKWYVVHTYSGHENKVKVNIEKIVENRGMQDLVLDIVVPTEDHVEVKDGQRKIKTRKMFPGYVIVKMIVTNESWYLVRNTQGVTGFVGHGSEPIPLTDEEVRRMGIEKITYDLDIELGDSVKVINGPFESFMGVVEEVNMDKQTLKVRISMFGRDTPVELEFGQIDKI